MTHERIAAVAVLAIVIWYVFSLRETDTHTSKFCAYGKVFVEFDDGKSKWGTLMLDWEGKPIPCKETNTPAVEQRNISI